MLYIVSGPTSVGKSTFIESARCKQITGLPAETPMLWPTAHARMDEARKEDFFYHYNFLRVLSDKRKSEQSDIERTHRAPTSALAFKQDFRWRDVNGRDVPKKAIVLVASKQVILRRLEQRVLVEKSDSASLKTNEYPSLHWKRLIEQEDLDTIYQAWCEELESCNIPYKIIDATDDTYPEVESKDQLPDIVNGVDSNYTRKQLEELLKKRKFSYHKVNLPYGLHTPGADRSETRDLILPESLTNKTVLDVGCALGYFSFEAEERKAKKVVGVELKDDRFRDAMLLKEIKNSKVDFLKRDIVTDPLDESFDYVLLLNVIHHLREPFRAIRQLASITSDRLIIEFPTFADRKFRKTVNIKFPALYNRLPLIGVSSMPGADQTFVFTPSAIKRAMMDHEHLFERVEIFRSPMPDRAIAVCHKNKNI